MIDGRPYDEEPFEVGIGKMVAIQDPGVLVAPALGSCVGVAIFDQRNVGGLAHVMLPVSKDRTPDPWRFADRAVSALIERLMALGGRRAALRAKIAGGAAMFGGDGRSQTVGERNVQEVRRQLALQRIPILAEDTGGGHARTVELHVPSGLVVVRSLRFRTLEL